MFRFFLLLAAFFLSMAALRAQPKCIIEHYSAQDGLSHEAVTSMLKDREGFMWFGTWNGINRFDGHSFVSYKSSPGDRSQLRNDRIDQIVEDQSNHLWLRAYDRAIYRFDKKTEQFLPLSTVINPGGQPVAFRRILSAGNGLVWLESMNDGLYAVPQDGLSQGRFTRYQKGLPAGYSLPSNTINFFYKDPEQRIWVGTSGGLCCLLRSASGLYTSSQPQPQLTAGVDVTVVTGDEQHLYFGTADGQLLTLEKRTGRFSRRPIANSRLNALFRSRRANHLYATTQAGELVTVDLAGQAVTTAAYRQAGLLRSIYEDRGGYLWLEPEVQGVIRYDPSARAFRHFSPDNPNPDNFAGNRYWVFEDNNGLLWVKMKGGGLGYYNRATASMESMFRGPSAAGDYRFSDVIHSLYYDEAGVLWLTTDERGLVKVIFPGDDFRQHLLEDPGQLKADNEVRGLAFDRRNRLWLGAKSSKLYVYENGRRLSNLFVNEPPGGLGPVYAILPDRSGNIWLGTKAHGLFKASPLDPEGTRYRLAHFPADKTNPRGLKGNEIYALLEDLQGRIWVGTFDEGLHLVTGTGDSLSFVPVTPALKNYSKDAFRKIRHLALDGAGRIWIGTTDGLLVLDAGSRPASGLRFSAYSKIPGDRQSLGNNDIQFLYRDAKNRMWLATSGGGFAHALGQEPLQELAFRNYTTRDGLPNDYVLSCTEDEKGNLWIATENGLSRFNPDQPAFRNYDAYDGLPRVGFSEAACRRGADGRIVFGTTRGYLSFHPDRIGVHRGPAKIALTALQINNEEAGPAGEEAVMKGNINYVPELTLRYNQDILTIDYALLDHRSGDRQGVAYRLIGFDTTWYNNKQQRRTTYTNLPPGHYVFEVQSLSTDLYGQTPYRRLAITIQPPPWRTWWAYLLYLVAAGLLIAAIRRTAMTLLRLRQKIAVEQKLAALKMSFFTHVSHELRTPLTLILNPIEQLARKEKFSPEGVALVEVVRKNAHRMVRFINQLLDLRKVQSDKARLQVARVEIVTLVRMTSDYFAEAARTRRIKLQVSAEQKNLFAWVDAEKLDTVLYNLLGNAFKFTPEGTTIRVGIRTLPGDQAFLVEVSDQGPGVAPEKLQAIFELYYEGEQRAGNDLKGTGIGLALSKELVELHGGTIRAANNEAGGLTVSVQLPLGRDHFDPARVSFVEASPVAPVPEKPVEQQLLPQPQYPVGPKGGEVPLVLLVEDNAELRTFLKGQLGEVYRVEVAANGAEGWQKALSLLPDLVVSDIMMPLMDGLQLLDKIRNDLNTSHIPVVLLSAKYAVESQVEGLKYGADYYITKPFENEFLLACIDNLLRQRKALFESLVEKKKTVPLSPEPIVVTSKDEAFLKDVIRVVEEKMADPDFNIETVAETVGMSRTTFYKKFKSLANLTPVEFVREMRLQRAKQYLDAGNSNISEAAYLAGFSNPKYFSTCFREKYHLSPSEYLKRFTPGLTPGPSPDGEGCPN